MLTTPRLHLRLLDPADSGLVTHYLLRNRAHFSGAGPLVSDEYFTEDFQRRRLTRELEMSEEGTLYRLWIYRGDGDIADGPIGDISLSHIVRGIMHSCFVGYKLDHEQCGQGLMTEALGAAIDFAFDRLHLHRIEANIMPRNTASQRVVEKLGFVREGCSSKYLMINGCWEDHFRYAKVNEEWSSGD